MIPAKYRQGAPLRAVVVKGDGYDILECTHKYIWAARPPMQNKLTMRRFCKECKKEQQHKKRLGHERTQNP